MLILFELWSDFFADELLSVAFGFSATSSRVNRSVSFLSALSKRFPPLAALFGGVSHRAGCDFTSTALGVLKGVEGDGEGVVERLEAEFGDLSRTSSKRLSGS
jgi:hypothetical protein